MKKQKKHLGEKFYIGCILGITLVLLLGIRLYFYQKDEKQTQSVEQIQTVAVGDVVPKEMLQETSWQEFFTVEEVTPELQKRIQDKSFYAQGPVTMEDLRYLQVLHYNFSHQVQVGELLVHQSIAQDCKQIFMELYQQEYEIQSMYLIDRYYVETGQDLETQRQMADVNSINNNNTSCFCYRLVEDSQVLSLHSYGLAIDINPLQNPCLEVDETGELTDKYLKIKDYVNREEKKEHMISQEDVCYQIFTKYGFEWGGNWSQKPDYQHFEKKIM